MGMDVYGKNPSSPKGRYFQRNVWGWHAPPDLIEELAPDLYEKCEYWHSNDGAGLDAADSRDLGQRLARFIDGGGAEAYVADRDALLAGLPDIPCWLCAGTGTRTDGMVVHNGCNACDGAGNLRPSPTKYGLEVEDIAEFAMFVSASGGFEIN